MNEKILFGTYRICGSLGNGSGSCVYLVRHIRLKQFRAIKCISKSIFRSDRSGFQQSTEPHILEAVRHSCIPVLYDYCEDSEYIYLVEEYVQGDTLDVFLRERKKISFSLFTKIASALADAALCLYASEYRYVYLEWKPTHVKIMGDNVRLLDFSGGFSENCPGRSDTPKIPCQKGPDVSGLAKLLLFVLPYVDRCKDEIRSLLMLCAETGDDRPTMEQLKSYFDRESGSERTGSSSLTDTSSKKIAVLGSGNSVGTTHFAISLSVYMNMRGMNAVYCGDNAIIDGIEKNMPHTVSSNDLIICAGFKGIKRSDAPADGLITIADMGVFRDWSIGLDECEDVFVILGSNPWEADDVLLVFERLKYRKNVHFLVSYGKSSVARRYTGKLRRKIGCFPLDADPFSADASKTAFFDALIQERR